VNIRKWLREPCPGDQLLRGHEVDIGQLEDGVDEPQESLLPVGSVEEPSSVEEEGEGGLRLGVVLQEVLRVSTEVQFCQGMNYISHKTQIIDG